VGLSAAIVTASYYWRNDLESSLANRFSPALG